MAALIIMVLACGGYGNVLRFPPPLVIPGHLLGEGLCILAGAFRELRSFTCGESLPNV